MNNTNNLIAGANQVFGTVQAPDALDRFGTVNTGIGALLSILTGVLMMGAGIYALFNFVLAGYAFMSADNDPGKVQAAWAKIYQTIIGLAFTGGAFVLASIVGKLLFNDWNALTSPIIPTP